MIEKIFKAYDVRATYPNPLNEEAAWKVGHATGQYLQRNRQNVAPAGRVKMESTLRGKRQLLALWKKQKGLCPRCHQRITKLTGWHSHHIIWKSLGGTDRIENRVLLHPVCHQKVHAEGQSVSKPRPSRGVSGA